MLFALALQAIEHFVTVLEVRSAAASERPFVGVDIAAMFISVELFSEANAANVTRELADFGVHGTLVLDEMILTFELHGALIA